MLTGPLSHAANLSPVLEIRPETEHARFLFDIPLSYHFNFPQALFMLLHFENFCSLHASSYRLCASPESSSIETLNARASLK